MGKFFKEYPGKPDTVIGAICGISLFFAYRYSLEQHGKNCLIVHKYDPTTSTQVEEKEYKL